MATTVKKVIVCGGNGFLGSRICRAAVARGWDVTSISRSGEPVWSSVTASASPPPWAHKVSWERADILKPATYAPLLKGADAVVHTLGILLEADYKGIISGREPPIDGLRKAFSAAKDDSQAPLGRNASENQRPQEKVRLTYELMNRDTAITLAQEASRERVAAFAFISAAAGAPVLPKRYITTKREAESAIASNFPNMRSVFIRPGILYDSSRAITMPVAAAAGLGALFNSVTGGIFGGFLGSAGTKPLKADVVADAVVEALNDDSVKGPVDIQEIEQLATKGWRKGML